MPGHIFKKNETGILCRSDRWQVISTLFTPDIGPLEDPQFEKWANRHPSVHDHAIEIIISLKGTMTFGLMGNGYLFGPGGVVVMDKAEKHVYPYPPYTPDCDHFLISFINGKVLYRKFSIRNGKELPVKLPKHILSRPELGPLFEHTIADIRSNTHLPQVLLRAKFIAALSLLTTQIITETLLEQSQIQKDALRKQIISTVQEYIITTRGKNITLDELARISGYSKFHLLRLFKKQTNMTVHDYINLSREKSVRELRGQGLSQKQIGFELGFSSPPAFSRWLKTR